MKTQLNTACSVIVGATIISGCAAGSGYHPPPERRAAERCPIGETWVCTDRYPSRIEREDERFLFCRCEDPVRLR